MWETPPVPTDGDRLAVLKTAAKKIKAVSDKTLFGLSRAAAVIGESTYISAGHCKLCAVCGCRFGKACARQKDVRYSLESLGVFVSPVTEKYFGEKLFWYRLDDTLNENGVKELPPKTAVVGGLLTNADLHPDLLIKHLSDENEISGNGADTSFGNDRL